MLCCYKGIVRRLAFSHCFFVYACNQKVDSRTHLLNHGSLSLLLLTLLQDNEIISLERLELAQRLETEKYNFITFQIYQLQVINFLGLINTTHIKTVLFDWTFLEWALKQIQVKNRLNYQSPVIRLQLDPLMSLMIYKH